MYDMKALYQAKSVADAVALRLAHPEAQIIAGGSDVLVQMREGKRAGVELISIYGLDELRGVTLEAIFFLCTPIKISMYIIARVIIFMTYMRFTLWVRYPS